MANRLRPSKNKQKGFSIIELSTVVAIASILASFAIPAYRDYVYRVKVAEILSLMPHDKIVIEEYYSNFGHWPPSGDELGLTKASSSHYLTNVVLFQSPTAIGYEVNLGGPDAMGGIELAAEVGNPVGILWTCRGSTENPLPEKYLPTPCQ